MSWLENRSADLCVYSRLMDATDGPDFEPLSPIQAASLGRLQDAAVAYLRRYHRFELDGCRELPREPSLIVSNHGFGAIFDVNVAALLAVGRILDVERPATVLSHQLAWTLGMGPIMELINARPASMQAAQEGFARGHHVIVLPGGDVDAFKPHQDRNKIVFAGRTGYARLAVEAGVPVVPIVTAGAGDSVRVLSDGRRLAGALRLDKLVRLKTLPVALSLPWGLNVGLVGFLPYLPMPAKIRTRVLAPIRPDPDESVADFARRIETAMQAALAEIAGTGDFPDGS